MEIDCYKPPTSDIDIDVDEVEIPEAGDFETKVVDLGYVSEAELGAFTEDYEMGRLEGEAAHVQFAKVADHWRKTQLEQVASGDFVPNDAGSEVGFFDWFSEEWLKKQNKNGEVEYELNLNTVAVALASGWRIQSVPGMCIRSIQIFEDFIAARKNQLAPVHIDL